MKTQSCKAKYKQATTAEDYLNQRLDKSEGCWLWLRGKDKNGYGQCQASFSARKHKVTRAHQLAYVAWVGLIPKGMFVCHSCDNPSCCNPDHLFLGTALDNNRDMVSKGRAIYPKRPHKNRQDIIDSWGKLPCEKVAKLYKISYSRVCQIWREVGLYKKQFHKGERVW